MDTKSVIDTKRDAGILIGESVNNIDYMSKKYEYYSKKFREGKIS